VCANHLQRLLERGFGGGFGLGTPVVSYAPRPMLQVGVSLVTMENSLCCGVPEIVQRIATSTRSRDECITVAL